MASCRNSGQTHMECVCETSGIVRARQDRHLPLRSSLLSAMLNHVVSVPGSEDRAVGPGALTTMESSRSSYSSPWKARARGYRKCGRWPYVCASVEAQIRQVAFFYICGGVFQDSCPGRVFLERNRIRRRWIVGRNCYTRVSLSRNGFFDCGIDDRL